MDAVDLREIEVREPDYGPAGADADTVGSSSGCKVPVATIGAARACNGSEKPRPLRRA